MRITTKSLTNLVHDLFSRLEIDLKIKEITVTKFTSDQYECGAVKQILRCYNDIYDDVTVYCFYSKKEIEECMKIGYVLCFKQQSARENRHQHEIDLCK